MISLPISLYLQDATVIHLYTLKYMYSTIWLAWNMNEELKHSLLVLDSTDK